ncbi:MAG TPA: LLM class flavin-dependent oxidoreductase [Thermoanaerobaculia bacterium]|nr:LLM class flavin-dependent oxidoreductase [Thermoanaerobaculia bacterium]
MRPTRFHWRLPLAGEEGADRGMPGVPRAAAALPDWPAHVAFCRLAERHGVDSLLMACGFYMPDPIPLVAALGTVTERIRFLLAYRSGLISPVAFVQQVNTLSALNGGRLALNMVIGHSEPEQRGYGDFLAHDERYQRADEFLSVCRAFWSGDGPVELAGRHYRIEGGRLATPFVAGPGGAAGRRGPEIYLGGGSPLARDLALKHADCWLRLGGTPEELRPDAEELGARGIEVGVRLSLVVRPTRREAVEAAYALAEGGDSQWVREVFVRGSDSVSMQETFSGEAARDAHWRTPYLWTGAVATRGASAVCLVGSPDEVAAAILEYRRAGVTQLIFSGWPNAETLTRFGEEVLPRVRALESAES